MHEELFKKVEDRFANRDLVKTQLTKLQKSEKKAKINLIRHEKALEFIKDIALKTQSQLEFHLSDMVTAGLNTVFTEPYDFIVKFLIRRGRTECDLFFEKDGQYVDPLRFSGLGAADIAAFALRCASWSMDKRYRNVILLDEPTKHLAVEHHHNAGKMIKTLSEKLGLQIIMITHSMAMTEYADKVFKIKRIKGVSKVKEYV